MNDHSQEQQPVSEDNEWTRFLESDKAPLYFADEVGDLLDEEITEITAPFIASCMLSREIERRYLERHYFDNRLQMDREPTLSDTEVSIADKKEIGEMHDVLIEARQGNFKRLKDRTKYWSLLYADVAGDFEGEEQQQYLRNSHNFSLVAERIPKTGDGSLIKVPDPAWMKPPVPLRIQLQQMKSGGESPR